MILRDPYEFRTLKWSKNDTAFTDINRYIVTEYSYLQDTQLLKLKEFSDGNRTFKPVILYGRTAIEKDVKPFNHPIVNPNNGWIAADFRAVVGYDTETNKPYVRNEAEYNLLIQQVVLTGMWVTGKQSSLYGFKFPQLVYGDWLATNISRKFGLNMNDMVRLTVLSVLYYSHQFTDEFTKEDIDKLKVRMKGEISENLIDEIANDAGPLNNIEDFCKACYSVTNNIRIKNLEFNVLVSILANNWFGLNGREHVLLALEYPPSWIALMYASLTQRSFRNSFLAKTAEGRSKRGAGEAFLKDLVHLTKTYKED